MNFHMTNYYVLQIVCKGTCTDGLASLLNREKEERKYKDLLYDNAKNRCC